jgi:hypothetical protein
MLLNAIADYHARIPKNILTYKVRGTSAHQWLLNATQWWMIVLPTNTFS